MNARYEHLLRKSRDAKRGGHEAWSVQSTGERVAVALVLNRADWLVELDYSIAESIDRSGPEWVAIIPQLLANSQRRTDIMTWTALKTHLPTVSGVVGAVVLTMLLLGTETGRDALGWIYLQSTQAIDRSIHVPFPLDRLDPTCPQCM